MVDANLGWHECQAPTKVGDYRINGPAMPAPGGCRPLVGTICRHPPDQWPFDGTPLVDANLGWHECQAPTKVGDYRINGPAMPAPGGCRPLVGTICRHPPDQWPFDGTPLVDANLGWHECQAPTKVGDYRINGPAMPAPGGCRPLVGTICRHPPDQWPFDGTPLVDANLGWHECQAPTKVGDYRINGPATPAPGRCRPLVGTICRQR